MDRYDREGAISDFGTFDKDGNPIIDEKVEKTPTDEVVETTVNNTTKENKFKLQFKKIRLGIVGGATVAAMIFTGSKISKHFKNLEAYEQFKNNNKIRTSSIFELVNTDSTSVDELLNADINQYNDYEKFRDMINAKRRYIDPNERVIGEFKTGSQLNVNYNTLTVEYIYDLDAQLTDCYSDIQLHPDNCQASKQKIGGLCDELYCIGEAINSYEESYGKDLVEAIANKVLASKVVDSKNLDPNNVSNINSEYNDKGKLKVTFNYDNNGKNKKYKATFKNDGYDRAKDIAKDLSEDKLLDVIHETKILDQDTEYDNFKVK